MISWPSALTLLERLALLRSEKLRLEEPRSENLSQSGMDTALAQQRFTRWQKETVFAEQEIRVEERLAADGIAESKFLSLLGTPASGLVRNVDAPPEMGI